MIKKTEIKEDQILVLTSSDISKEMEMNVSGYG